MINNDLEVNPYLEVRMKTLIGKMNPSEVSWHPLLQEEGLSAKDYKKLYTKQLGDPTAKYCIPCPKTNLQIKCYLFTKKSEDSKLQDKHIMLEYTKQLKKDKKHTKFR